MSKKRRIFDIDFDLDDVAAPETKSVSNPAIEPEMQRRGPMATAIAEAAGATAERQAAEAAIRAENDALAHEYVGLKKQGLVTARIPIDQVVFTKLIRDRAGDRDEDIDELKSSIRDIGLSNPIRVEMVDGQYELIQGFRRLTAFRELNAEYPDGGFDVIPAVMNARGENNATLYRRMVDENLVRRDVSFGELAQLAIYYGQANPAITSASDAVDELFQSASRQKRGHIRSFVRLLKMVDLAYVQEVSRNMGQQLLKKLEADAGQVGALRDVLAKHPYRSGADEVALLQAFLDQRETKPKPAVRPSGKTTFRVSSPKGAAKCLATDGRLELRMQYDFSSMPREQLESAVARFLADLE